MKPQYVFFILFALFITGLADGIEMALAGLGPLGIILGLVISWCINATMGTGLIFLLATNGMMGPGYWKFLFPGFIAEIIPGLNSLPFWVLVVALCIIKKTGEEAGSIVGGVARVATAVQLVASNPASVRGAARTLAAVKQIREAPQVAQTHEEAPEQTRRVGVDLKNINVKPQAA